MHFDIDQPKYEKWVKSEFLYPEVYKNAQLFYFQPNNYDKCLDAFLYYVFSFKDKIRIKRYFKKKSPE